MTKWQLVIPVLLSKSDEKEFRRRCFETAYIGVEKIYPGIKPMETIIHFVDARLEQDEGPSHEIRRIVTRLASDDLSIDPSMHVELTLREERFNNIDKCDFAWTEVECPNPAIGYTHYFGQFGHKVIFEWCDDCYERRTKRISDPNDPTAFLISRISDHTPFTRY